MKKFVMTAVFAATAALTAGAASASQYWVKEGIQLNARSGPGTGYHVIGKFHSCTSVHVHQYKHGWAKVSYKGGWYWVSAKYLQNHACNHYNGGHKNTYKHKSY